MPELRLAPTDVPYPRFREVETERTRYKREADELRQKYEPLDTKVTTLEQQIADATRRYDEVAPAKADLELLLGVLDTNPELRRQVFDELNSGRAIQPRAAGGGAVRPPSAAPPAAPGLAPEVNQRLERVLGVIEQAETNQRQEAARQAQAAFDSRVESQAATFLTERGYDPNLVVDPRSNLRVVDVVLDYMAVEGEKFGGGRIEDVPHLLNGWYARQEQIVSHRLKSYAGAKVADARAVPTSLPGGSPPVSVENKALPISDPRVTRQAIDFLRSRLQPTPA